MPEIPRNPAEEWRHLVAEWDAAMASYRAAVGPEVAEAKRRLAELKTKMDNVVADGRSDRAARDNRESLIVRAIDLGKADEK